MSTCSRDRAPTSRALNTGQGYFRSFLQPAVLFYLRQRTSRCDKGQPLQGAMLGSEAFRRWLACQEGLPDSREESMARECPAPSVACCWRPQSAQGIFHSLRPRDGVISDIRIIPAQANYLRCISLLGGAAGPDPGLEELRPEENRAGGSPADISRSTGNAAELPVSSSGDFSLWPRALSSTGVIRKRAVAYWARNRMSDPGCEGLQAKLTS